MQSLVVWTEKSGDVREFSPLEKKNLVTCHTYAQRQYGVHDARTGSYICETGLKIESQDKDSDLGWSYLKELRDGVIDPLQGLDVE
jgi:hypothetical protein